MPAFLTSVRTRKYLESIASNKTGNPLQDSQIGAKSAYGAKENSIKQNRKPQSLIEMRQYSVPEENQPTIELLDDSKLDQAQANILTRPQFPLPIFTTKDAVVTQSLSNASELKIEHLDPVPSMKHARVTSQRKQAKKR